MGKTLIFLTSQFPFGNGEPFIDNEIKFHDDAFDKIILISEDTCSEQTRSVSGNVNVIRYNNKKNLSDMVLSLKFLFNKHFRKELFKWLKKYDLRINSIIIRTCLNSISRASKKARFIKPLIDKEFSFNNEVVLYSYWCDENALALALIKTDHPYVKSFTRAHGWDVYFYRHEPKYLPFRNYIFSNLDKIFFISQNGLDYSLKKLDYSAKNNFDIARLGVEEGHFKRINSSEAKFNLLSCSNVIKLKRINLIIDALTKLDKRINFIWTHIGGGELLEEIKEYANKMLSESSNISYEIVGHKSHNFVIEFYKSHNIGLFINVSEFEGIPVSIMEAFSNGVPAVATDVGGNSEILKDAYNGILLSSNPSTEDIKKSIESFARMGIPEYNQFSENAYNTWNEKYNAEKNYKKFVAEISL